MSDEEHPERTLAPVVLVAHDPAWAAVFEAEAAAIRAATAPQLLRIEHVGSTSVPGIHAKPCIDIAATIDSFDAVPGCVDALAPLRYEYVPAFEDELPNRRYFRKDHHEPLAFHLHLYEHEHAEFLAMLRFRDKLRSDPAEARAYEALKLDLAGRLGRRDYTSAKAPFIANVLRRC